MLLNVMLHRSVVEILGRVLGQSEGVLVKLRLVPELLHILLVVFS